MSRHKNTDVSGRPFPPALIQAVWEKAAASPEHAPLRLDAFGSLIWREAFGNSSSKLGWEIHHRIPVEQGGDDDLANLEAVQWENHRRLDAAIAKMPPPEPEALEESAPSEDPKPATTEPGLTVPAPDLLQSAPAA
jgi:hypothetical protein